MAIRIRNMPADDLALHLSRWFNRPAILDRAFADIAGSASLGTWIGKRNQNEDQVVFCRLNSLNPELSFVVAIVCDGIGGMRDGGVAARLAAAALVSRLARSNRRLSREIVRDSVAYANDFVFAAFRANGGSTMSVIALSQDFRVAANIGDSRIHVVHDTNIRQLSLDDTLAAHLGPSASEAQNNPELASLLQYIGIGSPLQINILSIPELAAETRGYLLSSDGSYFVGTDVAQRLLNGTTSSYSFVRRLVATAEWFGGSDNASAIFLKTMPRLHDTAEIFSSTVLQVWDPFGTLEVWLDHDYSHAFAPNANAIAAPRKRGRSEKSASKAKNEKAKDLEQSASPVVLDFGLSSASKDQSPNTTLSKAIDDSAETKLASQRGDANNTDLACGGKPEFIHQELASSPVDTDTDSEQDVNKADHL